MINPTLDQITRCPKCGNADQAVKYHNSSKSERLGITCRRCGFERFVEPLDKAVSSQGTDA